MSIVEDLRHAAMRMQHTAEALRLANTQMEEMRAVKQSLSDLSGIADIHEKPRIIHPSDV